MPKRTTVYTVEDTLDGVKLVAIDGSLTVNLREGQVLDFGRSLHATQVVGAKQPSRITWFSTANKCFTGDRCGK